MTAMSATAIAELAGKSGRCEHGYHLATQGCVVCVPVAPLGMVTPTEWAVFVAAVKAVARPDRTVHQCDMRPLIRGRIEHKHIAQCYRTAKSKVVGLLVDTKEREESDDAIGRNTDKLDRIYSLGRAA